ncbi:MAG: gamma-glutamyltransferase [Candidatus Aminicenantes bacterium]|jgi:gamma-glutamyltranspeptidase/glutathione hydrolase
MLKNTKSYKIIPLLLFVFLLVYSGCGGEKGVIGENGMVVSVDPYASQVGINILKKGGNAVDAAVAVGFALAVTYPAAGNIGGGGFMILRFPETGESVAVDFREMAPGKAAPDMYLNEEGKHERLRSSRGHLAVGIPGTVKGFDLALKTYGRLSWEEVIEPAIQLADKGFVLTEGRANSFNRLRKGSKESKELLRVFSKPDGSKFEEGDLFVQKDLAETLEQIAEEGPDAFYKGQIADRIALDMEKHGGLITNEDLTNYKAYVREPIIGNYRGYEVISMPTPSSGGTVLIEMLNILEGYELGRMKRFSPKTLHLIAETMKFAYLDRAKYLGDGDFVELPVEKLTSKEYAGSVRDKIQMERAVPSEEIGENILTLEKGNETTHYSVIDGDGLAVATTYTLNDGYGAKVIAEGTGILLNNEMADFNMKPDYTDDTGFIGTEANLIRPYKRMLSSMSPTIIVKDGKVFMITGSPGGRTIINTVLNVILNVIDFKMGIQDAVDAARMDHEWMPDVLRIEEHALSSRLLKSLEALGHNVRKIRRQGDAHSILVDPKTGAYIGAADKRSKGSAMGY